MIGIKAKIVKMKKVKLNEQKKKLNKLFTIYTNKLPGTTELFFFC